MRRAAAFTLMELLLTLCVASIVALIAMQTWAAHAERSRRIAARSALMAAIAELERQQMRSGTYDIDSTLQNNAPDYVLSVHACGQRPLTQCAAVKAQPRRPDACGTLTLRTTGEREPASPTCWP